MKKDTKHSTPDKSDSNPQKDQQSVLTPALEAKMRQLANYLIDRVRREHKQQLQKQHRLLSEDPVES